jgi:hypothetical protein
MTKPTGKKSKSEDKTNKKKAAGENAKSVAKTPKPEKVKGPEPDFTPKVAKNAQKAADERLARMKLVSDDLSPLLHHAVSGFYRVEVPDGTIILEACPVNMKQSVFVVDSTSPSYQAHNYWYVQLYTTSLPIEKIVQKGSEWQHAWNMKLQHLLREKFALIPPLEKPAAKSATVQKEEKPEAKSAADLEAIKKAEERRKAKAERRREQEVETFQKDAALLAMKANCVALIRIATGSLGFCNLSSPSGDLLVQFQMEGGDRMVSVEHVGENHMLKLVGIGEGFKMFASYISHGISSTDKQRMLPGVFNQRSILAKHIREQMENAGVRFRKEMVPA